MERTGNIPLRIGAATGWYHYPFLDVTALGYPVVLRNIGLIGAIFLALGHGLQWIDGRLSA